jgi:predicted NUDIX family NTP pyrophosphohydrolase
MPKLSAGLLLYRVRGDVVASGWAVLGAQG